MTTKVWLTLKSGRVREFGRAELPGTIAELEQLKASIAAEASSSFTVDHVSVCDEPPPSRDGRKPILIPPPVIAEEPRSSVYIETILGRMIVGWRGSTPVVEVPPEWLVSNASPVRKKAVSEIEAGLAELCGSAKIVPIRVTP